MMRAVLLSLGLLTLAALWFGPLPGLAQRAFWAHMTLHMGVVAVAAPLLSFAIAGTAFDPVKKAPALFPPIPLSILELIVVWAWHAPALHFAARHTPLGFVAEQASFVIAGVLVWLSAFGGPLGYSQDRYATGVAALLLTSMHMTLLGALLALSPRALYFHVDYCIDVVSVLDDQHLGGAIMLLVGGVAYLAGGLWLTAALVRKYRQSFQEGLA